MTEIYCPVCGSSTHTPYIKNTLGNDLPPFDYAFTGRHMRTYEIVKCIECSHGFGIVPHKELWRNYKSVIDREYLSRQDERNLTARNVLEIISKYKERGKLLDVGCATGDFLIEARKYYRDVEGLELSEWSANIARGRGICVHSCTLGDMPSTEKYDIITLWGVIEHFENPQAEIKNIRRLLNNGGIVCLWTGDINNWLARLLGRHWWYIQGQHIQFFSKKSLKRLFNDKNFKTEAILNYPYTANISSLSKSLKRYENLNYIANRLINYQSLENIIIKPHIPGEMLAIFRKQSV